MEPTYSEAFEARLPWRAKLFGKAFANLDALFMTWRARIEGKNRAPL
jgi:hypothetical protein